MKKILVIICFIAIYNLVTAQELIVSQKCDYCRLSVDKEKNIIITGYFKGTRDFDFSENTAELTSGYYGDTYIACYDSLLNYKWVISLYNSLGVCERISSFHTDDSGNIYISLIAEDSTDFDPSSNTYYLTAPNNGSGYEYYIAKYDKNGSMVFVKPASLYGQHFRCITAVCDDAIYVDYIDSFKKLDTEGNLIWEKPLDWHLLPKFDGTSKFYFISDTLNNRYLERPLIIYAIDTTGNTVLHLNLTQSEESFFNFDEYRFNILNDKIFIQCYYWGDVDFDPSISNYILHNDQLYELIIHGEPTGIYLPGFQRCLAEYDLDGNFIRANDYSKFPGILTTDITGNLYASGYFNDSINLNFGSTPPICLYSSESAVYLAEFDSALNFISAIKITEAPDLQLWNGIEWIGTENYIRTLYFDSTFTILGGNISNIYLKQDTILNPQSYTYLNIYNNFQIPFIINDTLSDDNTTALPSILIYPNPAEDKIKICLPNTREPGLLRVYDINGDKQIEQQLMQKNNTVDVNELISGCYIIIVKFDKYVIVRKIIKQ